MSRVLRTTVRRAAFASALAGLTSMSIGAATAGDLGPPVYGPAPYIGAPYVAAPYEAPHAGPCHVLVQRRIDPYGRESLHRIRVCDEGPVYPGETAAPPDYGYQPPPRYYGPSPSGYDPYPPPRYYAPLPSGYDPYPRPPAPIPGYYNSGYYD